MEKLDVQLMANIALVPLFLPPGNRLQSDCASCFSCSLLGQFLSNLEPVPRVPLPAYKRLAPSYAAFHGGFSLKIQELARFHLKLFPIFDFS